jgi:hypothetical protein
MSESGSKEATKTREPSVSQRKEVKEIDLVESGSEDGEIVEVGEVDEGTQSKILSMETMGK